MWVFHLLKHLQPKLSKRKSSTQQVRHGRNYHRKGSSDKSKRRTNWVGLWIGVGSAIAAGFAGLWRSPWNHYIALLRDKWRHKSLERTEASNTSRTKDDRGKTFFSSFCTLAHRPHSSIWRKNFIIIFSTSPKVYQSVAKVASNVDESYQYLLFVIRSRLGVKTLSRNFAYCSHLL